VTAVPSENADTSPTQRDQDIASIVKGGDSAGRRTYGCRALAETAMGRFKAIIGPRLRSRCLAGQRTEAAIGVAGLNRMLAAGRPTSVCSERKTT
jgi:hypothetical protein